MKVRGCRSIDQVGTRGASSARLWGNSADRCRKLSREADRTVGKSIMRNRVCTIVGEVCSGRARRAVITIVMKRRARRNVGEVLACGAYSTRRWSRCASRIREGPSETDGAIHQLVMQREIGRRIDKEGTHGASSARCRGGCACGRGEPAGGTYGAVHKLVVKVRGCLSIGQVGARGAINARRRGGGN